MVARLGQVHAFGIEGTGSYGAGLARFLADRGYTVLEVNRPDRSIRYRKGKSDPTDAEMAARSVRLGRSTGKYPWVKQRQPSEDGATPHQSQARAK